MNRGKYSLKDPPQGGIPPKQPKQVKSRSNHQNNITFGFLDSKYPLIHVLCSIVVRTNENIFSDMADVGHFGF